MIYITGYYEAVRGWETLNFEWALIQDTWTPDPTVDVYMSDISAHESGDIDYLRQVMVPTPPIVNLPLTATSPGTVGFPAGSVDFGPLSGGEIITQLVLFNVVTNDSDSPLVASYPCLYYASGTSSASFIASSSGVLFLSTAC